MGCLALRRGCSPMLAPRLRSMDPSTTDRSEPRWIKARYRRFEHHSNFWQTRASGSRPGAEALPKCRRVPQATHTAPPRCHIELTASASEPGLGGEARRDSGQLPLTNRISMHSWIPRKIPLVSGPRKAPCPVDGSGGVPGQPLSASLDVPGGAARGVEHPGCVPAIQRSLSPVKLTLTVSAVGRILEQHGAHGADALDRKDSGAAQEVLSGFMAPCR